MRRLATSTGLPFILTLAACTGAVTVQGVPTPAPVGGVFAPGGTMQGTSSGSARFNLTSVVLAVGEEKNLAALLGTAFGPATAQEFIWTSSDSGVVLINAATGQARCVAPGNATIKATLRSDPSVWATIEVNAVENRTVVLLKVEPSRPTFQIGDKFKLGAEVHLADGQINGNVTWSSSDDTIATVNQTTGEVSALREGRVTIVASYSLDPRYKGLAEVSVVKDRALLPPSPSPSAVVFGPDATPLPSGSALPSLTPAASPSPSPTPASSQIPVARWVKQNSGTTKDLHDVCFVSATTGFAVGEGGTVLKTTNGGGTWTPLPSSSIGGGLLRGVSFTDASTGWVAEWGSNGRIYHTTDGGATWAPQFKPATSVDMGFEGIRFTSPSTGYAWSSSRLFKTVDGGATWTQDSGAPQPYMNSLKVSGGILWAGADPGTFKLVPGVGWAQMSSFPQGAPVFRKVSQVPDGTVWMFHGGSGSRVARSVDGGSNWTDIPLMTSSGVTLQLYGNGSFPGDIQFVDAKTGWIINQESILSTTDGGSTWKVSSFATGFGTLVSLQMLDKQTGWAVGWDGMILKLTSL